MLKDGQLVFRFEQQQHIQTVAGLCQWVWCAGNLKEGDHLVDLGVDGRIILKWI
jgi:hypothetical protein